MKLPSVPQVPELTGQTIAWVAPILGRSGRLMYMGHILRRLAAVTGDFHVVVAEYGGDTGNTGFDTIVSGGILRFYRPDPAGYSRGFTLTSPSILFALYRLRPSLLILNEFSITTLYGVLASLCRRYSRILLVVEAKPWTSTTGIISTVRARLRRFIASRADAVLTNNASGRDYVCNKLRVPADRVVSRPYLVSSFGDKADAAGPDISRFETLERGNKIEFLYVGEIIERKGLQQAISAFARLTAQQKNSFRFNIIGDGPYRQSLEQKVRLHGLGESIVFHGRQEYGRLRQFYTCAHVFLFPTHRDYRALAPFEALSCGLPILASILDGGTNETVDYGKNGYSFDPFDPDQLRSLLDRIIDDPGGLYQFARHSVELAQSYTLDAAIGTILDACKLALGHRK